jgi:Plasmid recombination enzyme.
MSYVVAHMEKMKAGNLNGVSIHDERKSKGHSNQDIDDSRTHLNYDLVTNRNGTLQQDIKNYIEQNKAKNALVRKDSVLVNEWVISSDQEFFRDLSEQKTREYFEATKEYFGHRFGDQNIRYAIVHLDETTPHLHMGIVPFDEKISCLVSEFLIEKHFEMFRTNCQNFCKNVVFKLSVEFVVRKIKT